MRMKLIRTGIKALAIVSILILLAIGVTSNPAMGQENGNHINGAPIMGGPGSPDGGYAGKFLVILCPSFEGYSWVEDWQHGTTLAEPVSLVGTCYASPGSAYKIEIPEGTVVSGYYSGQGRVTFLKVAVVDGQLYFSPNLKLSQQATLYKLVDGEWVEVLTFTQVLNGKATP